MNTERQSRFGDVAIVGVSALFPGSITSDGFWRDILAGRDLITGVPAERWLVEDYYDPDPSAPDKTYANRGAFLDKVDFDPMAWGIPPSIAPSTDTSQLLALIVAQRVLTDVAKGPFDDLDKDKISVILGVTSTQELLGAMVSRLQRPIWEKSLREAGLPEDQVVDACERIASHYVPWQEATFPGVLGNVVAGRICNRLDLGGTNCVTDAACASTFSALHMAINELYLGQSDMVVTGGVDTLNDIFMYMCFSKTPALSRSGDCRPFSDAADGTMLGEGIGMFALRRLEDAERDGNRIYAVIKGVGSSSDGRAKSVYAPLAAGQAKAIRRAYENAGYEPNSVELVEAHGTGTKAGDAAEFDGLRMVFRESDEGRDQWCALGSVKSQVGHTKAAAGSAGLFKVAMALAHRTIPPTIKIERPNPALEIDKSPFYLPSEARPWIRGSMHGRRGSVSSFGFGGTNFHIALEEYRGPNAAERLDSLPVHVVVLSAATPVELFKAVEKLAAEDMPEGRLPFVARRSQREFDASKPARLAVVAQDEVSLVKKLTRTHAQLAKSDKSFSTPDGVHYSNGGDAGQVAFLFSGQGSQYVGMGGDLARAFDEALTVWDRSADIPVGDDQFVHKVVFPEPVYTDEEREAQEAHLTSTEWAQPAIGVTSASMLQMLKSCGVQPDAVGGHSYGEVTALYAAGALDFATWLRVSRRRGELMANASETPGSMTAVVASVETLRPIVEASGEPVVLANQNSPSQVVLSGPTDAIERVEARLEGEGLTFKRLPVSTAFHSPLVSDSCGPFRSFLDSVEVRAPMISVFGNTNADAYPGDPVVIRERLSSQIAHPVRYVDMINAMYDSGIRTFVEVGPGSIQSRLVGQILDGRDHVSISTDRRSKSTLATFIESLGRLAVAGVSVDFDGIWNRYREPVDTAAIKKPRMAIPISGTNVKQPYPPEKGASGRPAPNPKSDSPEYKKEIAKKLGLSDGPKLPGTAQARQALDEFQRAKTLSRPSGESAPSALRSPSAPPSALPSTKPSAPPSVKKAQSSARPRSSTSPTPAARTTSPFERQTRNPSPASPPAAMSHNNRSSSNAPASVQHAWVGAYQEAQRQLANAHASYQESMANAHMAFLRAAEVSFVGLSTMVSGAPAPPPPAPDPRALGAAPSAPHARYQAPPEPAPAPVRAPAPAPAPAQAPPSAPRYSASPAPEARAAAPVAVPAAPAPVAPMAPAPTVAAPPVPAKPAAAPASDVTAAAPPVDRQDVTSLLLEVVAEKTGYPVEMLEMEMELEADLGVDSIKRVEILSEMTDRAPWLPEVDTGEMAALQTLGQIVEYLDDGAGTPASSATPSTPSTPSTSAPSTSSAGGSAEDIHALLLEVVAEKTGYPVEMLEPGMELEADLGVDSIKRVEILSEMTDRAPWLPEVDTGEMAAFQTLGQIVDYLHANAGGGSEPAPSQSAPAEAAAGVADKTAELTALLLDVVAEKTGYPSEMLELPMNLEADLGVDSIKRVEILSEMTDRAPWIPEVDTGEMAQLQTLGQIIEYMSANLGGGSTEGSVNPNFGRFEVVGAPVNPIDSPMLRLTNATRLVITRDGRGIAEALAGELGSRGRAADVVDSIPDDADAVIFMGGLRNSPTVEAAMSINRDAFFAAKAVATRFTEVGGAFVAVQDLGGDLGYGGEASEDAWSGGLTALAKTLAQEWPDSDVKAIDVQSRGENPSQVARRIADELLRGGPELEVGLRADGTRIVPRVTRRDVQRGELRATSSDVFVVSGGARGVTAATVIALARASQARFALLGRSKLADEAPFLAGAKTDAEIKRALLMHAKERGEKIAPAEIGRAARAVLSGREIRATIDAIAKVGGRALYLSADVAEPASVRAVLETVRAELGPITGVIHGAGVLADKLVVDKTVEMFDRVFDTKVKGLRALLDATSGDALRTLIVFSSIAARSGNAGQVDYAMANEVMGKVLAVERRRRGDACLVKSLDWGPWAGGMVDASLKAKFDALGVPLIELEVGAGWLVDELCDPSGEVIEIVFGGAPRSQPLTAGGEEEVSVPFVVDAQRYPYLRDHEVSGIPVVPLALVIEWFMRALRVLDTDETWMLEDVQVRRGVRLPEFGSGSSLLNVQIARRPEGVSLRLIDEDGGLLYTASASPRQPQPAVAAVSECSPWKRGHFYEGTLFHGPEFRVLKSISTIGETGMKGRLDGTRSREWSDQPWMTDMAAVDGLLQAALLWTEEVTGRASLPMGIGRVVHGSTLPEGSLEFRLARKKTGAQYALSDAELIDSNGRVVASLYDIRTVVRPDVPASSEKNG